MKINFGPFITLFVMSLWGCAQLSGVQQTPELQELQQKAHAGDLDSQYQLGLQYTINGKWSTDFSRGYDWLFSAAERGHLNAQYMVGMGKMFGRGTETDRKGAVKFFAMAAGRGHARAQYQAGDAFLNGVGVEKDQAWGRQWLEQAAWNDHKYAQFLLAALFSAGIGGESSNAEAWVWSKRASQNGLERAGEALQNLEEKMSGEELADGKNLLTRNSTFDGELYRVPRIRYIQTVLNQRGYDAGVEDGIEGFQTGAAIAEYVRQNSLPQKIRISDLIDSLRNNL